MPYKSNIDDNYYYAYWANIDNEGIPRSCWVKWDMNKDDFSIKVETEPEKKKEVPERLDFYTGVLKRRRSNKGYLTVGDVLNIFDLRDPKLFDGDNEVNSYDIYCGNLDEYVKDMKEYKKAYIDRIAESEDIDEIHDLVDSIHKIDKAIDYLDDCEECND